MPVSQSVLVVRHCFISVPTCLCEIPLSVCLAARPADDVVIMGSWWTDCVQEEKRFPRAVCVVHGDFRRDELFHVRSVSPLGIGSADRRRGSADPNPALYPSSSFSTHRQWQFIARRRSDGGTCSCSQERSCWGLRGVGSGGLRGVGSGKRFSRDIHQIVRQDCLNRHEAARLLPSKLRPRLRPTCSDTKQPQRLSNLVELTPRPL